MLQASWKRFVGLGTGFARNYRYDFFLRTEINIIALQVAYALLILTLAIGSLFVLYQELTDGIATAVTTALTATSTPITGASLVEPLIAARTRGIVSTAFLVLAATALFGYLVARLALSPARNALSAQKQFIGNIAHELRTPLSIIKANTEVRLLDRDLPETSRRVHESNLEELDRISNIINNLLSLNVLIRPERIPFANVDLVTIVRSASDKLAHLAHKKKLRIRITAARERIVWGNTSALEQITINILKNALSYTPSGSVAISVAPSGPGWINLVIRDSGVGIRPQDLQRIFEPFYRGDRARTRSGGAGSGLGLAIVSELVRLHHGQVSVQSVLGQGTSVTVALPAGKRVEQKPSGAGPESDHISADFSNRPHPKSNRRS